MKTIILYFSAERGATKTVAGRMAVAIGAELFPIEPEKPYSAADLNYMNPLARCNREKIARKDVPSAKAPQDFSAYDLVLVGFPIWYGGAPNVVNTFLQGCDLKGKRVAAFATSGGSPIGKTAEKLKPYLPGAELLDAKLFSSGASDEELRAWVEGLV